MMERIGVATIGVGALGEHHARIYASLPQAELLAVVDPREDRANEVASQYGCRALTDFRKLPHGVKAASLAAPTKDHGAIGEELLRRGIHLLVEKPIAASLEEADRLIAARDAGKAILHVGHTERFNPALRAVRPFVTQPQFFEAHRLGVFVPRSLDIDVVLDLMIHDLDLILWFAGSPVSEIRSVGIPVLTPRVDIANARIEFQNGCVANITASRVSREKIRKFRFFQPHDYISIDFHEQTVEMYSLQSEGATRRVVERSPEVTRQEPLRLELEAFLAAVGGSPVSGVCTGEEGRASLALALDIVSRAKVG